MSNWDELNLQQKAELMKIYTANGFNSLGGIIEHYNKFIDGGNITESVVTNKIPILERIGNKFIKVFRTPKDYSDEVTDITECAKFSNNRVREIVGKRPYGHAWTRSNNNVETIISGYDGLDRPSEYNRKDVLDYIFDAATNVKRNINLKDLQEGDIVGMYYRGSPNQFTAYTDGTNGEAQTHTGHIVYRKNKPYVEHNVHGDITLNKVKDVLGKNRPYGIVSISRMKANGGPLDWLLSKNGNAINYGANGNIPIVRYDDGGQTTLSSEDEKLFQDWYGMMSRMSGLSPNPDDPEHYYNYREYWKNTPKDQLIWLANDKFHFPDTYKLPGHPTFSDESIYSTKSNPGGHWVNDKLIPHDEWAKMYSDQLVEEYMKSISNLNSKYGMGRNFPNNRPYYIEGNDAKYIRFGNEVNSENAKFMSGRTYRQSVLDAAKYYADKYGLDPYELLSGFAIEGGNSLGLPDDLAEDKNNFTSNPYLNTHTYISFVFGNGLTPRENADKDTIYKNLGFYRNDGRYNYDYVNNKLQSAIDRVNSYINGDYVDNRFDQYAQMVAKKGWNSMNPKQEGSETPYGKVLVDYKTSIQRQADALRNNYPDLFK